ncbi:GntR family transcriptional regulator [Streptomyces poonensis]|uniref:HTH gntR-type domain-containing protein n=1 Tax=Streptomyces poonensis TaxID=68255 RepID=A0A918PFN8_9ACTN|nr:GntR family transcriptional regulator [Streptomyces poonensis]GGZ05780.1 hypothetical protein GCM10010365_26300 [Streptomyces poonensis]GLJ92594.1 hypothetical protein GCM10017589_52040 [Streptomyces poonensis]
MNAPYARIADGTYPLFEQVPSLADFAAEFGVSATIVAKALQPVRHEGLLARYPAAAAWS